MIEKQRQKTIKQILTQFDFVKVHFVMVLIGHKWEIDGRRTVPEVEKLRAHCAELLARACEIERAVSGGGFTAFCDGREVNLGYDLESVAVEMEVA